MYISFTEYVKIVKAPKVEAQTFDMTEIYAEAVLSSYTFNAIEKLNLLDDETYGDRIRKATAIQIDYMAGQGFDSCVDEAGKRVSSRTVNVGGTSESVAYSEDKSAMAGNGMRVSPAAASILAPVRAMGRTVR